MKVAWPGGAPVPAGRRRRCARGSMESLRHIVFAPDVILAGLTACRRRRRRDEPATLLDVAGRQLTRWPVFLPDGIHFLYFVRSATMNAGACTSVASTARVSMPAPLFRSESEAVYVPLSGRARASVLRRRTVGSRCVGSMRRRCCRRRCADHCGLSAGGTTLTQPAMLSASSDVLAFAASTIPFGNRLESSGGAANAFGSGTRPSRRTGLASRPTGVVSRASESID